MLGTYSQVRRGRMSQICDISPLIGVSILRMFYMYCIIQSQTNTSFPSINSPITCSCSFSREENPRAFAALVIINYAQFKMAVLLASWASPFAPRGRVWSFAIEQLVQVVCGNT